MTLIEELERLRKDYAKATRNCQLNDALDARREFEEKVWDNRDTIIAALKASETRLKNGFSIVGYPAWLSDLNNIVRSMEDEGDRVYLGSTNDADELRKIAEMFDDATHFKPLGPGPEGEG